MEDLLPDIDPAAARLLVRRAVDKAEQLGSSGAIAVVGASGALVTCSRMDEGGAGGIGRARSKAWIAATQKIPSTEHLHRMTSIHPPVAAGFAQVSPEAVFPGAGGMPIRDDRGRVIGGIAASGSTVSPFFPAGMDRSLTVVDGRPANPEDQVIAFALAQGYEGQHGDDLTRWEQSYGPFDAAEWIGRDAPAPPASCRQPHWVTALRIADAALDLAASQGQAVTVAVVDRRGELVQLDRMAGAPSGTTHVAEAIAASAALYGMPSGEVGDLVDRTGHLMPVPVAALDGGLPIVAEGHVIGAVAVAGPAPEDSLRIVSTVLEQRG